MYSFSEFVDLRWNWPETGATVEPFGSFVSNLYACWGDLDISIEFSKGTYISEYGRKHKEQLLGVVMRAMALRGWVVVLSFSSAYIIFVLITELVFDSFDVCSLQITLD